MTYLEIFAILISIVLILAAPILMNFWKGALAGMMAKNLSHERAESRNRSLEKANFICLGLMVACLIILGSFTELNFWTVLFYLSCAPIICLGTRNLTKNVDLFSTDLVKSRWVNYILVNLPLYYIFAFVYIRLILELIM